MKVPRRRFSRRLIGYSMLEPHDLRHGVAMEVYEQHGDLQREGTDDGDFL